MDKFIGGIGAAVVGASAICILPVLGTLFGAFAGWVVGWFFEETILGIASQLGIDGVTMWQLGAALGFVGGFLKTKVTATVKPAP